MILGRSEIEALPGPLLVVGAGSFVGASLMRHLSCFRKDVVGLCRYSRWRIDDLPSSQIEFLDLREKERVRSFLRELQPSVIFYCVAYGGHPHENEESLIFETQIDVLQRFKEAVVEEVKDLRAFVHAGSSSEYGFHSDAPSEEDPLRPDSAYSAAKGAASLMLSYWGKRQSFPCVNLRLYSVYGEGEDPSRLMPQLLYRGLTGQNLQLAEPQISRDFVHVEDVCRAFVLAAHRMSPELYGSSINIGTGRNTTLHSLIDLASRLNCIRKDQVSWHSYKPRLWDRDRWCASISKAQELLGWNPSIRLEEAIEKLKEFYGNPTRMHPVYLSALRFGTRVREASRVSLIVACYKDQDSISEIYQSFKREMESIQQDFEILFVNDASPDKSSEMILELSRLDRRVRGLVHARSFGSQAAFLSGLEMARGEAVILMDGDQQDPPSVAREMIELWRKGAPVVLARRVSRIEPLLLQHARRVFYKFLSRVAEFPVDRDVGDFALFDRRVRQVILKSKQNIPFLRLHRSYAGFDIQSVSYVRPKRKYGQSTNSIISNFRWALLGFVSSGTKPLGWGGVILTLSVIVSLWQPVLWFLPLLAGLIFTLIVLAYLKFAWPGWIQRPAYVRSEFIYDGERHPA